MPSLEETLGFEFEPAGDGGLRVHVVLRDEHTNLAGYLHGAVPFALADNAMGGLLFRRHLEAEGRHCATVETSARFIRTASAGDRLTATPRMVHLGRRFAVVEAEVRGANDALVLVASATFALRDAPPGS